MTNTSRTQHELLATMFADGQAAGAITPQDMRDLIVSLSPPMMGVYVSSPALTAITTIGAFTKILGTTSVSSATADYSTGGVNNRLQFNGPAPRHMHIVAQASVALASGTNQVVAIQVWHYDASVGSGSYLPQSLAINTLKTTDLEQITTHGDVTMDSGDYLELHIANNTSGADVTAQAMYLFAMGMMMGMP
jgi:hypothetical protein